MSDEARRSYAPRLPPDERREQLLDAALHLIGTEGYDAITIASIAREAGVTRPVVYGQFPSLADLLSALLHRQAQRALAQVASAMPIDPGDRDPDEVLRNGLRAFLSAVESDPDTWRPILLPPESTPERLRERMIHTRGQIADALEHVVQWGMVKRGLNPETDAQLLTMTLMALFEQAGRLVLNDPVTFPPERFVRLAQNLMEAPLTAPAAGSSRAAR
jgi:AcrR family transcriptional regulator